MNIYFYAGSSGDAYGVKNSSYCLYTNGSPGTKSEGGKTVYSNRYFYLDISQSGTLTFVQNAKLKDGPSYVVSTTSAPSTSSYIASTADGESGTASYTYTINVTYNSSTATRVWFAYPNKGYITSITWTPTASCSAPTSPTNGASTSSSRVVRWTAPASAPAGGYLVAYSSATSTAPGDAVQAAGTNGNYTVVAVAAGTTTATLSTLSASTTYNWWVRSKCGDSSFSSWVAGTAFTTDAPPCGSTAQAALTLSSSSGTICGTGTTTFTVSGGSGTGELSVSSSDETKATASIDGSTVTVTGVAAGSATITVTKACDATYAEATATYSATVAAVPTANAGADKTTELETGVALAATAAASGCAGAWTIVSGPNTATSQLSNTSSATATFTPTAAGTYTLRWTVTNTSSSCSAYDDMTVTAATCAISSCGNATLTYAINASTSVTNTAANLISSATASNTTAMGINGTAALSTITIGSSDNAGKAAAATSTCYPTKPTMSSKIGMYSGSSYSSSNYLQFGFIVKSGYTFTPCDIQFTVQPVSSAGNFRWEITDGTNSYGYGVATDVPKGGDGGASVLTGLGSTAEMEAGTYYIRLYPYDNESNTFRISNNVILKGTTAAVASDAYDIHIGKNNADYTDESLTNTSGTTWSKDITLDAGSYYEFKVKKTPSVGEAVWYGNNGKITATTSPAWDFSTGVGSNCKLYTSVAGSYTFSWDTSNDKLTITYPSGEHTTKRVYMVCGDTWCNASPKFFVHSWGVSDYNTQVQQNACGEYYADIIWYNDYFQFTRNASDATAYNNGSWTNYSENLTYNSSKTKWTCTGWSDGKGTFSSSAYSPTTYTITFAGNGNSGGSMSAIEEICEGIDQDLTANAYTKTGYDFAGWKTNAALTYVAYGDDDDGTHEVSAAVNDIVPDKAKIKEVGSNITLTAQWTAKTCSLSYKDEGHSDLTGIRIETFPRTHTYGSSTALTKATRDGYVFGGWYKDKECTNGPITSIGATDYDCSSKIYLYAKWTAMNLDALESETLYKVEDMVPAGVTIGSSTPYYPGVSANNRFNIRGSSRLSGDANAGMCPRVEETERTIDGVGFTNVYGFRKPASGTDGTDLGSSLPDNHAIQFKISGDGLLDIYCYYADSIFMVKDGGSAVVLAANTKAQKVTKEVTAGTYYLYSTRNSTHQRLYGLKFTPTLTAISADVLYQAADMASNGSSWGTESDTWFTGLSTYNLFKTYGDGTSTSAKGKTVSSTSITDDIGSKSFTSLAYIMPADNLSSESDPTKGAIEIITPSTAGLLYVYTNNASTNLNLKKKGQNSTTALSGAKYKAVAVDANTHYFIVNNGGKSNREIYGIQYVSTYAVSITPTHVTKATGETGAGVAVKGKAYTATFTANTGYTLPSDVTVSIGGTPATKGTEYTWSVSDGTGTLTVKAANVTGAIAVTVSGVAAATYTLTTTVGTSEAAASGATITNGVVASIPAGTTVTNNGDNTFTVNTASPTTVTATASVAGVAGPDDDPCTYAFISWENLPATVTADVSNIHALYEARFTIRFKETDGTAVAGISSTYYVYGTGKAVSTFPTPTKSGYTFAGWYTNVALTSPATDLDDEAYGAIDYYAKWTLKTTTITLDKNGGDTNGSATATYGSKDLTITHATRTGYTQNGYRTAPSGGDMIIKKDGTLDGSHEGYTSSKTWIYDGETLTLYAQWTANKYNVTHTLSNVSRSSGDEAGSKKATYGTEYSVVFEAESGYALPVAVTVTVGGSNVTANCTWNQGTGELTIPAADVTGDIVITVTGVLTCTDPGLGFENASLTKYTGESVSNTLTNTHNVEVSYSSSDEAVATVNSSGAVTIKGVGSTIITATAVAQTVSAVPYCADAASYNLTVNPYTITYELNEGEWGGVSHKDTYTKFDEGYDLPTPTKTDYTFLGWYANSGFTGDRVYILPAGSTGNKTYWAKWGSAVTATWTITDNEGGDDAFYKGGGGHHVTAVLDQADWDASGSAGDLDLSASEGVTLSSVTKGVYTSGDNDGKAYVEADFSISGDIDEDAISFFLNVPATGDYAAAELSEELTLNDCPGGSSDVYVVGYTNSTGTSTGSASNKCLLVEDTWYTSTSPSFTDKTSTDGFTITCNNASSYYWVQGTPGFSGTSTGATMKALKIGNGNSCTIKWTNDELAFSKMKIVGRNAAANDPTTLTVSNDGGTTTKTFTFEKGNTTPQSQEVEMLFSSGETKGICITGGDKEINVLLELTPVASGASGVPTTLSWSDDLADKAEVNKNNVDADFIYTATPSTNTIGAITYTSSDESVATVDGNGKVHIIKKGETTITATLAESGCYTGDEITYTLKVKSTCEDVRGTIVAADGSAIAGNSIEKGACETVTLKLTGYTDGASIQWQKDGAPISGANSAEYTVPTDGAGVYTAVTTKTCDLTSNSVTVTSASSTIAPTIFADEFTVKSYRPFEYRLMQLNEGETCTFKSATSWINESDFKITTEGNIVTIKGDKKIESDADETITLTISNGCSSEDKEILIHATTASAKKMIAWIATGDKGVKDNVLADQSTNTDLYKALVAKDEYALTPRNCYWTTDEKELIKEYSQYDLVILTDYPDSRKGPNSGDDRSKSYTNALGLLIDRVPMLTFEAFVAGCPNWGLSSNPKNTSSTQNSLTLLCNANDIFGTSDAFNAGASVAVGTAAEGQALQGFELDAMPNFVFIAKITDDGTDYVTCCERQVNTNARMMVFGLNQNLMNAITDTGEDMVAGFVDYLLLDETASIPDCSVIFKGTGGTDWSNTGNWEGASLPNPYASVRIDAPCVVGDDETAKAGMIKIHTGSDAGHTYTGSLTIQPQGRMIVENGVYRVEGTNYATYLPTEPNNLVINADAGHTGALIFSNPRGNTQATVYLYSKATTSTCWQYVGIPFGSLSPAVSWFYNAWMMKYTTGTTTGDDVLYSWEYINNYDVLNGFQGYALTQTAAKSYQLQGGLAPTTDKVLAVSNAGGKGWNLYANSWTAPIHIDKMEASDFVNADATIYLYNTGSRADWKDLTVDEAGTSTTAGQYLAVPVGLAEYTGTKYIPSMQGFFVQGNHASAAGSVRLRYDAVVRDTTVMADLNTPLRTPSRETVNQEPEHVTMVVRGEKYTDVLHLFRSDEWSAGYENGYDAHKVEGDDYTPQLYAVTGKEELAVVATDEWEGTVLNFRAGSEDVEYTIFFRYNESEAEALYLYDLTTETYTRIENGGSYHFSTTDKETHPRFILTYNAPSVATGTGDVQRDDVQSTKARKVLLDNHVYIFRNGNLYDSTGKMVK